MKEDYFGDNFRTMSSYVAVNHKRILSQAGSSFTLICFIVFVKVFVFQLYHRVHHRPQQVSLPLGEDEEQHNFILGRRLLQATGDLRGGDSECLGLLKCLSKLNGRIALGRNSRSNCEEYYSSCRKGRRL